MKMKIVTIVWGWQLKKELGNPITPEARVKPYHHQFSDILALYS